MKTKKILFKDKNNEENRKKVIELYKHDMGKINREKKVFKN